MYFALEGIDGSGKSTILKVLKKEFPEATFVREPGTSKFAEDIRNAIFSENFGSLKPMTIQLAMLTARSDLKQYVEDKPFVISDRCFLSACYCEEMTSNKDISDWIELTKKYAAIPDLIIYLDITADTSIERVGNRKDKNGYDSINKEDIEKRIEAYNKWLDISNEFNIRSVKVNANKSIKEVSNEIKTIINDFRSKEVCQRKEY